MSPYFPRTKSTLGAMRESTMLIGIPGREPIQALEPNPAFTDSDLPMLFRSAPEFGFAGRWVMSAANTLSLG